MIEKKHCFQVAIIQAILLIFLGLYDLFSLGLPPIDKGSMFAVFPRIFPIIIGSIFLFVLPLLKESSNSWIWVLFVFSLLLIFAALQVSISVAARRFIMITLILLNAFAAIVYLSFLSKFRKK